MIEVINIKTNSIPTDGKYFYIGRNIGNINGSNPLSNPFTSIKNKKTFAKYIVNSREESIEKFKEYFYKEIQTNQYLQMQLNFMYNIYTNGTKIYLGCFCKPLPCHGDIIKKYIEDVFLSNQLKNI